MNVTLSSPVYNLEEKLDIFLVEPFNEHIQNLKVAIKTIIEDESIINLTGILNQHWSEYLNIENNLIGDSKLEIFYVAEVRKPFSFDYLIEGAEIKTNVSLNVGERILIPQSFINQTLTRNMQMESNSFILDFDFDYSLTYFESPNKLIEDIKKYISEKTNANILINSREVVKYDEDDVKSIYKLLHLYYKIDNNEENLRSIKNILSSTDIIQTVRSTSNRKKIEIYVSKVNHRELVCAVYNKKVKEERTFRY